MKKVAKTISKLILAAVIAAAAFSMTACSSSSVNVRSTMTVTADFAGSRTVMLDASEEDITEHVEGGTDTVTDILDAAAPSWVDTSVEIEEGRYVYSITFDFSSLSDYESCVVSLLEAGAVDKDLEIEYSHSDSPFRSECYYTENVTNSELMQWARNALDTSDYADVFDSCYFSNSSNDVEIAGKSYDCSWSVYINDYEEYTLYSPTVDTYLNMDGSMTRTITMTARPSVVEHFDEIGTPLDSYFKSVAPSGASVTTKTAEDDESTIYIITYAGTPDAITAGTDSLLQNKSFLKYELKESTREIGTLTLNYKENFNFAYYTSNTPYCSIHFFEDVTKELSALGNYTMSDDSWGWIYENVCDYYGYSDETYQVGFDMKLNPESAAVDFALKSEKSNTMTLTLEPNALYSNEWKSIFINGITAANSYEDEKGNLKEYAKMTILYVDADGKAVNEDTAAGSVNAVTNIELKFTGSEEAIEEAVNCFFGAYAEDFTYRNEVTWKDTQSALVAGNEAEEDSVNNDFFDVEYTEMGSVNPLKTYSAGYVYINFTNLINTQITVNEDAATKLPNVNDDGQINNFGSYFFYSSSWSILRLVLLGVGALAAIFGIVWVLTHLKEIGAAAQDAKVKKQQREAARLAAAAQQAAAQQAAAQQAAAQQQMQAPVYTAPVQQPAQPVQQAQAPVYTAPVQKPVTPAAPVQTAADDDDGYEE